MCVTVRGGAWAFQPSAGNQAFVFVDTINGVVRAEGAGKLMHMRQFSGTSITNSASGSITLDGQATLQVQDALTNFGSIILNDLATLEETSTLTNSGSIDVYGLATLLAPSTLTTSGAITVRDQATLDLLVQLATATPRGACSGCGTADGSSVGTTGVG